jgi:hypothetical protein
MLECIQGKRSSFLSNSDVFSCAQQANGTLVGFMIWVGMYMDYLVRARM